MKSQFIDNTRKTQVIHYEEIPSLMPLNLNKKKRERYSNQDFQLTPKVPKIQKVSILTPKVSKVPILSLNIPNAQKVSILSRSDSDENEKSIRLYYSASGEKFSKEELSINILDTVTKLFWNIQSNVYPIKLVSIDICDKTLNETLHQKNRNITIKSYFDNYDFQNNFIDIYSSIFVVS
jgi:hypothetical protein